MHSTEFLLEATFNIGQDVDMLYNLLFRNLVKDIHNENWDGRLVDNTESLSTGILQSKEARKAHKMNPMRISTSHHNSYDPTTRVLSVAINRNVLDLLRSCDMSYSKSLKFLTQHHPGQVRMFTADITPARIKGSIYHELSHWLDDTFHNRHISKTVNLAQELGASALRQGEQYVGLTKYEINAQIHAIKQLKRNNNKIWNTLSFDQMVDLSAALQTVEGALSTDDKKRWKQMILRRMAREGLLGDSMKKS
jgi:valyl-tRNA synthetase